MRLDNDKCPHGCNSLGQVLFKGDWIPCPIHGVKKEVVLRGGTLPDGTSLYDILRIPKEYEGEWVEKAETLFTDVESLKYCTPESIHSLQNIMSQVFNSIAREKGVYPVSLYMYGSMVDLRPWVYTIQRIGLENGLSVLPLTTVNELAGIVALQDFPSMPIKDDYDIAILSKYNRVAAVGADWYLQTKLSYIDYLKASVCFIEDSNATAPANLKILAGFIEERARKGLPTYVVSSVFLNDVRNVLVDDRGLSYHRLTKLSSYQLMSKKVAGEMARDGKAVNSIIKPVSAVQGSSVLGKSVNYFED